jgi:hypothetical protein
MERRKRVVGGVSDFGVVYVCGCVCWIVGLLDHEDRARGISVGHDVTQKLTHKNQQSHSDEIQSRGYLFVSDILHTCDIYLAKLMDILDILSLEVTLTHERLIEMDANVFHHCWHLIDNTPTTKLPLESHYYLSVSDPFLSLSISTTCGVSIRGCS